ncbi:MAG: PEP-CTERM sorting domain-containing protein [Phycisphaeraceae bacterium]|nr:PEP-CTERM sorting domain-containing protein [Phycisphaeraceae bacterium]
MIRKSAFRVCAAAVGLAGLSVSASAALLSHESFETYSEGSAISGANDGQGWTGAWAGQAAATIAGTGLSYSGGDINIDGGGQALRILGDSNNNMATRTFAPQSDTFYFSFLFQSPTAGAETERDFFQVWLSDGSYSGTNSASVAHDQFSGATHRFLARIAKNSGGPFFNDLDTVVNETYLVVGKVSKTGDSGANFDRVDIFINPTTLTEPAVSSVFDTGDTNRSSMSVLGIRTALLESTDEYLLDEFRIGTTWASVIPEPGSLAIAMMLGGAMLLRRRR